MAAFLDLPLSVRQRIYRLHLVRCEPITFAEHKKMIKWKPGSLSNGRYIPCRFAPPIISVSKKVEREAAPIYYGENEFDFAALNGAYSDGGTAMEFRLCTYPRHFRLIQNVTAFIVPFSYSILAPCRVLGKMKGLRRLRIGVDEKEMLRRVRQQRLKMQWHQARAEYSPDATSQQHHLVMLSVPGMSGLLSLSGIEDFEFTNRQSAGSVSSSGPISGGFLETYAMPKIRAKSQNVHQNNQQTDGFRFLDLHAELRNVIYRLLLSFPGSLHPSKESPTSKIIQRYNTKATEHPGETRTVLSLLGVCRQIRDEAVGIFYANPFVFYYPSQLGAFVMNLGSLRQICIKDVTVYYQSLPQGGIDIVDLAFLALFQLKGLQKLHILLNGELKRKLDNSGYRRWGIHAGRHLENANPALLPGMKILFKLRGIHDIKVRDLQLESEIKELQKRTAYPIFARGSTEAKHIRLDEALTHFNAALVLAQNGHVVKEILEDRAWQAKAEFPSLQIPKQAAMAAGDRSEA